MENKHYVLFGLFQNEVGGLNSWITSFEKELVEQGQKVTKISFYGSKDEKNDFFIKESSRVSQIVDTLNILRYSSKKAAKKINYFLTNDKYIVIITHPILSKFVLNSNLNNQKNITILQYHSDKKYVYENINSYTLIHRWLLNKYITQFDFFSVFTNQEKLYMEKKGYKNCLVLKNGIDFEKKDLKEKKNKILFISRMAKGKNCEFIFDLSISLINDLRKYNYIFDINVAVSNRNKKDMNKYKKFVEKINSLNAADVIKISPGTFGNDKVKKMTESKFTLSYSDFEGMPMFLLESFMYRCVPIFNISTNNLIDYIHDGKNGYLVKTKSEFEKRIRDVIADDNIFQELSSGKDMSKIISQKEIIQDFINKI